MKKYKSLWFYIYCIIITALSAVMQSNMKESVGIPFFVVMMVIGVSFKTIKDSESSTNNSKSVYQSILHISTGLGIMIFAIFLYLNVVLFSRGESLLIWLGITWLTMIIGIVKVWFGIIDINNQLKRLISNIENEIYPND